MPDRSKRPGYFATMLALTLGLSACDVASPPAIRSTVSGLPQRVFLSNGQPKGTRPAAMEVEFNQQLVAALEKRGVAVQEGSGFGLVVALSLASTDIGITQSLGQAGQPVTWSEAPRKHRMLDGCRPQRLRVVVSTSAAAASPQKLAEGEVSACRITQTQSAALATKLAEELTRR